MVGVANKEDSMLSIFNAPLVSTNILKEFEGGRVVVGFLKPIVLSLIFSVAVGQATPPLEHHSVNLAIMYVELDVTLVGVKAVLTAPPAVSWKKVNKLMVATFS